MHMHAYAHRGVAYMEMGKTLLATRDLDAALGMARCVLECVYVCMYVSLMIHLHACERA